MIKAINYLKYNPSFLSKNKENGQIVDKADKGTESTSSNSLFKEIKENPRTETHLL